MSAQPNFHETRYAETTYTGAADGNASVGSLLRELAREVPALMTNELALAKSEMQENLSATKAGAGAVATGGVVALGGFLMLLLAAVYGLSTVVAPWLAALIVGAVVLVIGLGMVQAGKKKFEVRSLKPRHTIDSLHKDADAVTRRTT
ncbi:phage holin family protein [Coralloluteibacterium stylophorae]|uniref:Phage holin family protein n=1 Tax=Coralloluteibacterium stylophorae TaxID=1776034 RepID=A0A8J8AYI4_9GAMM|nr:phage holin family protein [Coralloluteibacterium stylophorae]MBS7458859.1 phage holin family protein [Coralloluteibacterium stylophorae]